MSECRILDIYPAEFGQITLYVVTIKTHQGNEQLDVYAESESQAKMLVIDYFETKLNQSVQI